MAKEAQRMANVSLKFFDNVADTSKDLGLVYLVFTSNALQYCLSPLRFLKQLTKVNAQYLFISRTAFSDTCEDIYSTQESNLSDNGPGPLPLEYTDRKITYPITYSSKSKAEEILKENYHIHFAILDDGAAYKVGNKEIDMFCYFCARKSKINSTAS